MGQRISKGVKDLLIEKNIEGWHIAGTTRVSTYFYTSQAVELRRD